MEFSALAGNGMEQASSDAVVGPSGLEPPTSRLSVVRSNQLSYGPAVRFCTLLARHPRLSQKNA